MSLKSSPSSASLLLSSQLVALEVATIINSNSAMAAVITAVTIIIIADYNIASENIELHGTNNH